MSKIRDFFKTLKGGTPAGMIEGAVKGMTKVIADKIDDRNFTEEERARWELDLKEMEHEATKLSMDFEIEVIKDRQSARSMYQTDNQSQKYLTLIFTIGYFAITTYMIALVMKMINQDLNDFVVSFVSSIFGAFNAIMIQIISFYFGSSKGGEEQGAKIADSFKASQ